MAMQHRDGIESATEPPDCLRREADFGHQHDRLPAVAHHFANRLNVNLGLPAAGHAVQQKRLVPTGTQHRENCRQCGPLVAIQLEVVLLFDLSDVGLETVGSATRGENQPLLFQRIDRSRAAAGRFSQFVAPQRFLGHTQHVHHSPLLGRQLQFFQRGAGRGISTKMRDQPRPRFLLHPGGYHAFQHLPPPAQILLANPACQFQHLRRQQRPTVDDGVQRF